MRLGVETIKAPNRGTKAVKLHNGPKIVFKALVIGGRFLLRWGLHVAAAEGEGKAISRRRNLTALRRGYFGGL